MYSSKYIMLKITPLFSGSRGNSTLIQTSTQNILLDLGYGFKATVAKLNNLGVAPQSVNAIVVTHEHGDHIGALPNWTKHFHTRVFAPKNCCDYIAQTCFCGDIFPVDGSFDLEDLFVDIFRCSHDARACLGYRFFDGKTAAASVTDTGEVTPILTEFLSPCETVILESNHDVDMLKNGRYPYVLKRRILSELGHLSNEQAAQVLQSLAQSKLKTVVLAHLSQQNNTKQKAFDCVASALSQKGVSVGKDIAVFVADQYENEVTV